MNFHFKEFVLAVLFLAFFASSCKPSLTKKEIIGYSVAAAAGAAALTGAYLFWNNNDDDSLDNVEVVDKNGEKVLQPKAVEKKKFKQVIADALKFMIIPSAIGLGTYWVLGQHTPEGKLKNFDTRNEKIRLGINKKFSNGTRSLAYYLDETDLIKLINANFGKETNCPLIEAERFLKNQKEFLQEPVQFLEEVRAGKIGLKYDDLKMRTQDTERLSNKISDALDVIKKQPDYQEQLKRYDSLEKDRIQREELSTQRKHDFAKILLIIVGTSIIAGKIVAPFV